MPKVKFTSALKRFFPTLGETHLEASTVKEVIDQLNVQYPGLSDYLVDERGHLRQHVNVFVQDELIRDRAALTDGVAAHDEVVIFQALSGG